MQTILLNIEKTNRMNFRNCLEALSRPGTTYNLEPLFDSCLLAMASVLLYSEVSYHYQGTLDFQMVSALTGSKHGKVETADYLFCDTIDPIFLEKAKRGTANDPENNATIFFHCDNLDDGKTVQLSGPGIDGTTRRILPLGKDVIDSFIHKNSEYPMGVDLLLVDSMNRIIGLPRTVKIEAIL